MSDGAGARAAADPVVIIRLCGVRHHGPGSARALQRLLDAEVPDIVLVEGPAEADAITALAVDPEMRPPVAMLGHVLNHPQRAAFYPFASFSPEWIAITWAGTRGVPVRWIDLPLKHSLAPSPASDEVDLIAERDETGVPPQAQDPLGELARAAGYADAERWWEDVLEHRTDANEHRSSDPFAAIAEAMVAVRAVLQPGDEPPSPREQRREAAMRDGIRIAVADGFRHIVVVVGAWHVPALGNALDPRRAKRDKALLAKLPKVKAAITWVPWTHRRLATATGYGAGVMAPGWYDHLFTHAGPEVIIRWFTEAARVLRAADHATSAADVVEATRLADALAALRGRPLPGLEEVNDVARAVLGAGTDIPMRLLSNDLVIGARIGSVPSSTPMVPLARDLVAEQRRCRLKPAAAARALELDLRKPLDLERSRLLHRLTLLDIPWGIESEGRGTTGTFRETWQLRWEPELDVRIIECAALGTQVRAAALVSLVQHARAADGLGELTSLLERCLLAGLDDALPGVVALVAERSAVANDVDRLLESLPTLARTVRYGDVRGTDASSLREVIHSIVGRVVAGLTVAATALDDGGASAFAIRLRDAQAALALFADRRELQRFEAGLADLSEGPRLHGRLQGLATRLLGDSGAMTPDEVERRLSRALSRGSVPADSAAFVEGFLGGSGAVLVHDPMLLGVLDGWLATLAAESFAEALPLLRRTFGEFDAAERRAIGERVRTGDAPGGRRGQFLLDPERAAAGLVTIGRLLGVKA